MQKNLTLLQGQYFVGDKENIVTTLLGSCVSIILWDSTRKIGAMSHCLLPNRVESDKPLDPKYCDEVLKIMIKQLQTLGVTASQCEAKVFGGAHLNSDFKTVKMGPKNAETALMELKKYNIPITQKDLLGNKHRRITFNVNTGNVIYN